MSGEMTLVYWIGFILISASALTLFNMYRTLAFTTIRDARTKSKGNPFNISAFQDNSTSRGAPPSIFLV